MSGILFFIFASCEPLSNKLLIHCLSARVKCIVMFVLLQIVNWKSHSTIEKLYGDLLSISERLRTRSLRFAGHFTRSESEVVSKVLFETNTWEEIRRITKERLHQTFS